MYSTYGSNKCWKWPWRACDDRSCVPPNMLYVWNFLHSSRCPTLLAQVPRCFLHICIAILITGFLKHFKNSHIKCSGCCRNKLELTWKLASWTKHKNSTTKHYVVLSDYHKFSVVRLIMMHILQCWVLAPHCYDFCASLSTNTNSNRHDIFHVSK
jgi:hypothetical protein